MELIAGMRINLVEYDEFIHRTSGYVKFQNSLIFVFNADKGGSLECTAVRRGDVLSRRQEIIVRYVQTVFSNYFTTAENRADLHGKSFIFQGDDRPNDAVSLSWQRRFDFKNVLLLPDFYYVFSGGYQDFLQRQSHPWIDRKPVIFWRGSTTGTPGNLTVDTLSELQRFQLCERGLSLGAKADFAICNVSQANSDEDRLNIESYLDARNLLKPRVPMEEYEKYKFFIEIDGNGNSWELVKKLRLGSCMLRVDSPWILWHFPNLKPWIHYVPVSSDLRDLGDKIDWCFSHDGDAKEIGYQARKYAMSISFEDEMRLSAMATVNFIPLAESLLPSAGVIKT